MRPSFCQAAWPNLQHGFVITVAAALFMDKQVSYALDGNKDLFIFLGLVANLSYIVALDTYNIYRKRGGGLSFA